MRAAIYRTLLDAADDLCAQLETQLCLLCTQVHEVNARPPPPSDSAANLQALDANAKSASRSFYAYNMRL